MPYDLIRTEYAQIRLEDKLEYLLRVFHNDQAYNHLKNEVNRVETLLCCNPYINPAHYDKDNYEFRYAIVNVGEDYYIKYSIDESIIIVTDYLHRRELDD